ncbi:MAG: sensor histidine kinase [Clostridiaceae bacterium]|nr:sensor histidine kinase [Clostridiaceae bacterium]
MNILRRLQARLTRHLVNKFILLFTGVLLFFICLQAVISYSMLRDQAIADEISSNTEVLDFVGKELDSYLGGITAALTARLDYDQITKAVLNEQNNYQDQMYLEDYLRNLFYSRSDIAAAYFYLLDKDRFYYISRLQKETMVRIGQGNPNMNRILTGTFQTADRNWFVESLPELKAAQYDVDPESMFIAFHTAILHIPTRTPQVILTVFLDHTVRDQMIGDAALQKGEHLIWSGADGSVYYTDDADFYSRLRQASPLLTASGADAGENSTETGTMQTLTIQGEEYLAISRVTAKYHWRLTKLIPYVQISEAASLNRNLSLFVGISSILAASLVVSFFARAITRPLKHLSGKMDAFSQGQFDVEAQIEGHDEIAQISQQFNQMAHKTKELIHETYQLELSQKNALLKSLVAELNPHFLYNALQAISTQALKDHNIKVYEMIDALSQTFRYCISGGDIVPLRQEISHVQNYLLLQKARYGDRLLVDFDLDADVLDLEIPKLTIQLLTENAIKHALEKTSRGITIAIQAKIENENLLITVKDDGPGIDPDKLEQIRRSLQQTDIQQDAPEIGLKNLSIRLRIVFGQASGIRIQAGPAGTEVQIRIPVG